MTGYKDETYEPNPDAVKVYDKLYAIYSALHDSFGISGTKNDLSYIMKDLLEIRREVVG